MVKIIFFASLRETLGCSELELLLDKPQSLSRIKKMLGQKLAGADAVLSQESVLCAVNQEMASARVVVKAGDEVAFFPPVTGG